MPRLNLSPEGRERHERFLIGMFRFTIWAITEYRDSCVYKTKSTGLQVVANLNHPPFRPGSGMILVKED